MKIEDVVMCNVCHAKIEGADEIIASQIYVPLEHPREGYLYWNLCRPHMVKFTESIWEFSRTERELSRERGEYVTALSHVL